MANVMDCDCLAITLTFVLMPLGKGELILTQLGPKLKHNQRILPVVRFFNKAKMKYETTLKNIVIYTKLYYTQGSSCNYYRYMGNSNIIWLPPLFSKIVERNVERLFTLRKEL